MKYLPSIFLLLLLQACVVVQTPRPSQKASTDQSGSKPTKAEINPPQADQQAEDQPKTIADTIQACKNMQAARDIPITCKTKYIEGKLAMFMGFPSKEVARNLIDPVAEYIAGPYCEAANKANRQALLVMAVNNEREARIFYCERREWSAWFTLDQRKELQAPQNISEAITACENIQAANDIPVGCKSTYIQGNPTLFLSFPDMATLQEYIKPLSEYLGGPFCASANDASRSAFLIFALANTKMARFYSCESGEASEWQSLDGKGV